MKKILLAALIVGAAIFAPHKALATTCSIPNTFTNGTTADATQVNANFTALQSCGNAIDFRNIGGAGIYASQIIPTTTAQATFGGAVGYVFNPTIAAQVPLTILGATSQSGDLFDVCTTSCATAKYMWVDGGGQIHSAGNITLGTTTSGTLYMTSLQNRGINFDGSNYNTIGSGNLTLASSGSLQTGSSSYGATAESLAGTLTLTPLTTAGVLLNSAAGVVSSSAGPLAIANGGTSVTSIPTTTCLGWSGTAFTSPACATGGGSGVTGATAPVTFSSGTVACATCAVTNANNNFSVGQTITGTATVNSGVVGDTSLGAGLWRIMPPSGNQLMLQGTNAAAGNIYFNYSSGATGAISGAGIQVYDGGTTNHSTVSYNNITSGGTIQGSSNGSTVSYHPPVYTAAGAAVASTAHIVVGTCTFAASTSCAVTLSGAAAFASATSYGCAADGGATSSAATFQVSNKAASSFTVFGSASTSQTVGYVCAGT